MKNRNEFFGKTSENIHVADRQRAAVCKHKILTKAATILLVTELSALGAASGSMRETPKIERAMAELPKYAPEHVCEVPSDSESLSATILEGFAADCIESRSDPIALVTFNIPPAKAQAIADEAERAIADGFDGIVHPNIVPIPASSKAVEMFNEANTGCIDTDNIERYAARIADNAMDLDDYRYVIGMTSLETCKAIMGSSAKGMSHSDHESRYMDIFMTKPDLPFEYKEKDIEAAVIGHEWGHGALNISHSGALRNSVYANPLDMYYGNETAEIDVMQLIKDNDAYEYSQPKNIMSSIVDADAAHLNTMQLRNILWTEHIAEGKLDPRVHFNDTLARMELSYEALHKYAALRLDDLVTIKSTGGSTLTFDHLVFDPVADHKGNPQHPIGVRIYLADDESARTLLLGTVSGSEESPYHQSFTIGEQSVELKINADDGFWVEDISN